MDRLKDKKINIIGEVKIENEIGEIDQRYDVIHKNIWAYYRRLSSREQYLVSNKVETIAEVMFEINYREGITSDMLVEYNGRYYEIVGEPDDFEGYKENLRLKCVYSDKGPY